MRGTRDGWAVVAVAGILVALAALAARPVLLVGGAVLGAWLLARQYAFVRSVARTATELHVECTVTPNRIRTDESAQISIVATRPTPEPIGLSITPDIPAGAIAEDATITSATTTSATTASATTANDSSLRLGLQAGEREARTAATLTWPVTGRFTLGPTTVEATDGLFRSRLYRGAPVEVDVEPCGVGNLHVGEGGDPLAAGVGEHETGRLGSGTDPRELREYVSGDPARRIDWKTTARLGRPHVREFEAETDRQTVLLVDHRSTMGSGGSGESKLAYARQVLLAFVETARRFSDPLGVYTVGDEGVTGYRTPSATPRHFSTVRDEILDLSPMPPGDDRRKTSPDATDRQGALRSARARPAAARRTAARLSACADQFERALEPYFAARDPYLERVERDPLVATARTHLARLRGSLLTVIVTDDSDPSEVYETVTVARRGDDRVLLFLTPNVLFSPIDDRERAYEEYAAFEAFRRRLSRLDRVSAYEIAPGDRLNAILAAGRDRANRTRTERSEPNASGASDGADPVDVEHDRRADDAYPGYQKVTER